LNSGRLLFKSLHLAEDLKHILDRCEKGDEQSQRLLFNKMKLVWMGICVRYIKDRDDAKDVFQESVIKIFNGLKSIHEVRSFEPWARKIIVNTALNYIKARQSYLSVVNQYETAKENSFDKTDEEVLNRIDNEQLLRIIDLIPDGYKIVLNMYLIDGYSHQEISTILNISESTSRSQLSKAKSFLKNLLAQNKFQYEKAG
jgi:RNA polymerase sigma-70 factor (ECF subfamily)